MRLNGVSCGREGGGISACDGEEGDLVDGERRRWDAGKQGSREGKRGNAR